MEASEELHCLCVEKSVLLLTLKPGEDDNRAKKGVSSQELQTPTQPLLTGTCLVRQDSGCPIRVISGHTDFYPNGLSNPSYLFCEPVNDCVTLLSCAYSAVPRKLTPRKGCHEASLFDSGTRGSDRSDGLSSQWASKFSISPSTCSVSFGKREVWCQGSALHMAPSLCEQSTG